ncbi:DUF262 domain-containing protein [Yersinia enterocolitica]
MDNGEKKISSLFDGRTIFNIPEYQRSYAWGKIQLNDFINDIKNQRRGKSYFLGTILFEEKGLEDSYEIIDVVDGQQRITTIVIFMKCLIKSLKNTSDTEKEKDELELLSETYVKHRKQYKLRTQQDDNDFFHSYILEDNEGDSFIRTSSQRRLLEAKQYFMSSLSFLSKDELNEFKYKIDECSRVLVYSVKDTAEATLIFETTNDRGRGLTNLEKIKSFMMYKAHIASDEAVNLLLDKIRSRFGEIYREHECFNNEIDEDSLLQYHFISYGDWTGKDYQLHVYYLKSSINRLISTGGNDKALEYIDTYSKQLKETFYAAREILNSDLSYLRDIFILNRVGNFWPLLIKTFKCDNSYDKSHFSIVARFLSIYSFRVYVVNQSRGNTGQSTLFNLAKEFSGDFNFLYLKLEGLIGTYCNDRTFKLGLMYSDLYERMASKDLCYFYWKYENYLRMNFQPKSSPMSEQELCSHNSKFKMSIEHIASQNPRAGVITDMSIVPDITEEFQEKYLHCIGNLTLDPLSANSSKGNIDFNCKNSSYFIKSSFKCQNELNEFLDDGKWTDVSINSRAEKITRFALEQWSATFEK